MAKMVLWSAMKGRVVMNGKPAAGAVLVRNYFWHWANEKGTDRTVADATGAFTFPAIEGQSLLGGLLPHQPVIEQDMVIEYQGKSYDAWSFMKGSYKADMENNGHPISVTCRLDAERARHGGITGLCEFD